MKYLIQVEAFPALYQSNRSAHQASRAMASIMNSRWKTARSIDASYPSLASLQIELNDYHLSEMAQFLMSIENSSPDLEIRAFILDSWVVERELVKVN